MDIEKNPTHNVLDDTFYGGLLQLVEQGVLLAVLGGPNCRTLSIRLHIKKLHCGSPLRGRDPTELCGLSNLSQTDKTKLDNDSLPRPRQLHLIDVALNISGT